MSIQDDVKRARTELKKSRRFLAERSGLTESVIWRIETKGTASGAEAARLQPVLDRLLGGGPDDHSADAEVPGSGGQASRVPGSASSRSAGLADSPANQVTPGEPGGQTPAEPAEPEPLVVDWSGLTTVAGNVSEHDLERGLQVGPDRSQGYRLFSNSELQTFKDCRRRWWLSWYRMLKPKFESPIGALAIGDRIHRALRLYYVPTGLPKTDPRVALERLITEDWTKVSATLANEPDKLASIQKKFNDEATLERAMIQGYVEWLADTGADSEFDVIASEQYMEADVTSGLQMHPAMMTLDAPKGVKLIGKFDVRVKRRRDDVRLFLDHKSLADLNSVRQTVGLDEQMLYYHLIEFLTSQEGEERCDGALYNMLRKVKRTANARPPFYDRVEVRHSRVELANFKERVLGTIVDVLSVESLLNAGGSHRDVAYPRPTRDCRWKCQFFSVCTMFDDGSRVEDMLTQWFIKGDPLAYYGIGTSEGDIIE